jgi:hypothetical protein
MTAPDRTRTGHDQFVGDDNRKVQACSELDTVGRGLPKKTSKRNNHLSAERATLTCLSVAGQAGRCVQTLNQLARKQERRLNRA